MSQEKRNLLKPVKPQVHFPQLEESILEFWEKNQIFQASLNSHSKKKPHPFYKGPPFSTGLPHYGHLIGNIVKDILPRYWTMKGYYVPRRFGWDCHGLPVEYEINKAYHLMSRKEVLKMSVAHYNEACRNIVQKYSQEWKKFIQRIGRWVDMDHAYFTMNVEYMQSVWWVFKELWKKNLIYEGYKVVPYSTGLFTPLSHFEANSNYKLVQDPAITVKFKLCNYQNTYLLAWTTTPWTLPSNLALAIGKNIGYVKIQEKKSKDFFILARVLLEKIFQSSEIQLIESIDPQFLEHQAYEPPFPYFTSLREQGAFKILSSDHVDTSKGTGIVHLAPAFGEVDYEICLREKIPLINPVDEEGCFTQEVPDFYGQKVKETDSKIISILKQKSLLFKHETITHSYPFSWRTQTPLIYYAVSSWFVAVEKIKKQIIANNQFTSWIPSNLKEGRFGNWLENARDWAISRNRFWGTPIPIWKNEAGEIQCIGSKKELENQSGKLVHDLHIDHVDSIMIPSATHSSPLKRVQGVLDCWFESGCMPYAQWGYPFKNFDQFQSYFPAEFVAEGLDQTRGWFYTLMVISTALFNQPPFKNAIVNGLILAEDGKKMSKSLRNYPDPMEVLNQYGADALRLYLIASPALKAQEFKFSEKGVKDIARKILVRWWNAYSFFVNYANIDQFIPQGNADQSPNLLDQWLLSRLHDFIHHTQEKMQLYQLDQIVFAFFHFIEELTNTYIRFNRRHFWKSGMPADKCFAYETLYEVLISLSKLMAPFTPFLSEEIYQNLSKISQPAQLSVHLESIPQPCIALRNIQLEKAVAIMEALILLGRNSREKISIKAKIPLKAMTIIHRDPQILELLKKFEPYFQEELNFRNIQYTDQENQFIQISTKANFAQLGPKFGKKTPTIASKIHALSLEEILTLESKKMLLLEGQTIHLSDIEILRKPKPGYPYLNIHPLISINIDPLLTPEQIQEGLAREVIRKIQMSRKHADLILDDRIQIEYHCSSTEIQEAIKTHLTLIQSETLCTQLQWTNSPQGQHIENVEINGQCLQIGLTKI